MNGLARFTRLVAWAALAGSATLATAQEIRTYLPPSIQAAGEAVVHAQPDRAQIDVGVTTQAGESRAAAEQNAKTTEAVIRALRKVLPPGSEVRTVNYALHPNYRYPREGGQPTITGYTATNMVRVTLDDLSRVSDVIDTGMRSGANQIGAIQFMLRDEHAVRAMALREAAQKARARADALASALGLRIVRVLNVSESSQPPVYPMMRAMAQDARMEAASAAPVTPIESGTIEVRANVSLTVEIADR